MSAAEWTDAALAPVRQLWRPAESYRQLTRSPAVAMMAALLVVLLANAALVPLLFGDRAIEESRRDLAESLVLEGRTAAQADSLSAAEADAFREGRWAIPLIELVTRAFYALIGGLATFGVVYAASWDWKRSLWRHLKAAWMAMAAYAVVSLLLAALSRLLGAPWLGGPSPAMLMPIPAEPSRLYVFAFRFLQHLDLQSAATVTVWGIGVSSLFERSPSFGLKLVAFVYSCGLFLLAAPVLLAG